jgi:hypothetical protein
MKKLLCIFAIAIASNGFAQDTTKISYRGRNITMIAYRNPTHDIKLKEVQLKCDSLQMSSTCNVAQIWEIEDGLNARKGIIYKALHYEEIKEVHLNAKRYFTMCRSNYDRYKACVQMNGVK